MNEDAKEIFDYLPIRRDTTENDYINHLWEAFTVLDESDEAARPFAVMPFHLLFMMAVQYKVLRIAKAQKQASDLFFSGVGGRSKTQLLSEQRSVFDIALIHERTIPEIFQLIGLNVTEIKKIKGLIDERNDNLAHAKGGIERDFEKKINEYISAIDLIQKCCPNINQELIDEWISEIQIGDDMSQFLERHFFDYRLTPSDFGDIIGNLLGAERLDFDQWQQVVDKGLELSYDQTILALRTIAKKDLYDGKRYNAVRILQENDEIDKEFKRSILENENDVEILELLKK